MNTAIKLIAGGAAAYFLYEYFVAPKTASAAPATTGSTQIVTSTNGAPIQTSTAPPVTSPGVTAAQLIAAAIDSTGAAWGPVGTTTQTWDSWNYYTSQGRNKPTDSVDGFPAGNRQYAMTIQEYWASRKAHGLSGLGCGCDQIDSQFAPGYQIGFLAPYWPYPRKA